MNKRIYLLLSFLFLFLGANAAPGDTTWVQAHVGTHLSWYGDYDTTIAFPGGNTSYRRIYMIFTLGKYSCPGYDPNNPGDQPGQTGWCGDWDYTVQNYIMTPAGDTLELGRFITPYARENAPRTPMSWTQRYIYDVTDYYPLLKNNRTIRIHYSGYSGGFTADVKFAFVEGTRERDVLGIDRLYSGSWAYGNAADPIENHLPTLTKTAPAGTQSAELKFTVTGHGFDGTGCSEFCDKFYQVFLGANMIEQKSIWRDNCGFNDLYPQSGTWIYDRANWCPGALVFSNIHKLTGVTGGNNYDVNVDMENYTDNGGASYTIESAVFYYGAMNKGLDASLDAVIAPSNFEGNYRQNPLCGNPKVEVKNTGNTAISSIKFEYGLDGTSQSQYIWNGNIVSLNQTTIELPEPWELRMASGDTATKGFTTKILEVNGTTDADATNNEIKNQFKAAPKWPNKMIFKLKTNNPTNASGFSETSWTILDANGNIVKQRKDNAPATLYTDTVDLGPSCYKLVVTDEGCDGLVWPWNPSSVGTGYFSVTKYGSVLPTTIIPYFGGNFGCGFTQYFTVNWTTGVPELSNGTAFSSLEATPNPANNNVTVAISGLSEVKGTLQVVDAAGRVVLKQACSNFKETLNVAGLSNGVYTIVFNGDKSMDNRLQTKLVIAR